ncbi:monovalent cation/H(+) antiporter subunit G [Priestia endophytica]|uniref:monovalent cation/H(+) antiporter subunit G n=1 Tax=Priestia TaxID=2800373 RepID=UPI00228251AE|nr:MULTISPECIES: monovalent cation/H(+) antiporter subunit G [Priestia]MCY8231598.1 monovalent cation/H(+) antiporter subunit G [Priestia endophytica]MED3724822.1 monovalent cation/H(+) antiporter subunit G [Priestia filamentosa]
MTETAKLIVGILVLLGSLLSLITTIGMLRFPDTYTRAHAASKSATLGIMLTLIGTAAYFWFTKGYISAKVILGIVFVLMTTPVASHLITRASYNKGVALWKGSVRDDLKEKYKKQKQEQ